MGTGPGCYPWQQRWLKRYGSVVQLESLLNCSRLVANVAKNLVGDPNLPVVLFVFGVRSRTVKEDLVSSTTIEPSLVKTRTFCCLSKVQVSSASNRSLTVLLSYITISRRARRARSFSSSVRPIRSRGLTWAAMAVLTSDSVRVYLFVGYVTAVSLNEFRCGKNHHDTTQIHCHHN